MKFFTNTQLIIFEISGKMRKEDIDIQANQCCKLSK